MKLDRVIFYDSLRDNLFKGGFTSSQVKGIDDLLDAWELYGNDNANHLAYILAGVYHETGKLMTPVREGFAKTNQGAINAVKKLYDQKRISKNYALPNKAGVSFYGRGRIQNTWEDNYVKLEKRFGLPFTTNPDLLLDSVVDAKVTVVGHLEGIWTGKSLSYYIDEEDELDSEDLREYKEGRRIVNGTDKALAIGEYALKFENAVRKAIVVKPSETPVVEVKVEMPTTPPKVAKGSLLDVFLSILGLKR